LLKAGFEREEREEREKPRDHVSVSRVERNQALSSAVGQMN
jgi:hypothetical protein